MCHHLHNAVLPTGYQRKQQLRQVKHGRGKSLTNALNNYNSINDSFERNVVLFEHQAPAFLTLPPNVLTKYSLSSLKTDLRSGECASHALVP